LAANLKGRLARIRSLGLVKAAELGEADSKKALSSRRERPSCLNDWERLGDFAWTRVLRYESPLLASLDPAVFAPLRRGRRDAQAALPGEPGRQARIPVERLRFFDLETTGLSGGTCTLAFLAAVGRIEGGDFELTQLFLEDFPGEGIFIEALLKLFGEGDAMVSYNGKAFDMPLLRTRCVMNAMPPPRLACHLDALFASRRLWRRVHGGASLGLLEREVLGIERAEDLPGAMIPEAWLDFARKGDNPLMRLVLSHNADDVIGLARLAARLQSIFDDPRSRLAQSDIDLAGLGRSLLAVGRLEEGEELLEAALGGGDEGAGLLLSRRYRAERRPRDAERVAGMLPSTYASALERAKSYERLLRDLPSAALWAREALRLAPGPTEREAAARRLLRIERRMARKG
jgi:uncharacterized protein